MIIDMKKILAILALPAIFILAGAPCIFSSGSDSGVCGFGMLWTLPWAFVLLVADLAYIIVVFNLRGKKIPGLIPLAFLVMVIIVFLIRMWPQISPLLG